MIREFKDSTSRGPKEPTFQASAESSFKRKAAELLTNISMVVIVEIAVKNFIYLKIIICCGYQFKKKRFLTISY